jgi:hypothetical protein
MRRGPQVESIILTTEESTRLLEWARRHKTAQALALRARISLSHRDKFCWEMPVSRASCAAVSKLTPVSRATISPLSAI